MKEDLKNQFFDINKLPAKPGIVVFPISMSRIGNAQSHDKCFEYMEHFSPDKFQLSEAGLNFIYTETLYMSMGGEADELKWRFHEETKKHKDGFSKLMMKDKWRIPKAVSYNSWTQVLLDTENFTNYFLKLKKIYQEDDKFQAYIKRDADNIDRKLSESQVNFFLEEHALFYLILKGKVPLKNDFVQGNEKWVLVAYPGKPLYAQVYVLQQNFFKLENPQNKYENSWYDLSEKKLYDFDRIDLETIEL